MKLTGLHLLLTYQCNFECDHCFIWGSPWQSGTMTLKNIKHILKEAKNTSSITSIYFEGGEPFLYYPIMKSGVQEAHTLGFSVGIVSNAYWATSLEDAIIWLKPFAGLIDDLSVSSDLYHYSKIQSEQAENAVNAAEQLGIPIGVISIEQPGINDSSDVVGQLPYGLSSIMYRGRAAAKLIPHADLHSWNIFTECPHEDLNDPGRIHVDPFGFLHICQGISIGNIFQSNLSTICDEYEVLKHPITGPIHRGGPVQLVKHYNLPHNDEYADACHMCDHMRRLLRVHFPDWLVPDQAYGVDLQPE